MGATCRLPEFAVHCTCVRHGHHTGAYWPMRASQTRAFYKTEPLGLDSLDFPLRVAAVWIVPHVHVVPYAALRIQVGVAARGPEREGTIRDLSDFPLAVGTAGVVPNMHIRP